jgi:hypothetical protein
MNVHLLDVFSVENLNKAHILPFSHFHVRKKNIIFTVWTVLKVEHNMDMHRAFVLTQTCVLLVAVKFKSGG